HCLHRCSVLLLLALPVLLQRVLVVFYLFYTFLRLFLFFFFNDPAPTEIYTLSLHDALPICILRDLATTRRCLGRIRASLSQQWRSEEHTSELQSPYDLVCRLLLEKKKKNIKTNHDRDKETDNQRQKYTNRGTFQREKIMIVG